MASSIRWLACAMSRTIPMPIRQKDFRIRPQMVDTVAPAKAAMAKVTKRSI